MTAAAAGSKIAGVMYRATKVKRFDFPPGRTVAGKYQIERVIGIEGALDADQRKRLMEIADKCPVHRTLTSEIRIVTKAAE